jgi:hypothetical protein
MARNYLYFKTLLSAGQKKHFCYFPEADSQLLGGLVHDQALETPTLEQPKEFEDNHDNDSKAIKERSARNSESEVNSNRSVSLGKAGPARLRQFWHLCSPHLSHSPKFL